MTSRGTIALPTKSASSFQKWRAMQARHADVDDLEGRKLVLWEETLMGVKHRQREESYGCTCLAQWSEEVSSKF